MLTGPKLKAFTDLFNQSTKEELIWINGYLSGLITTQEQPAAGSIPAVTATNKKITIAYGTETGNSKKLATDFAAKAKKKGIQAKLVNLEQYRFAELPKEEYFITVISTQGEGEPPIGAQKFYDHIHNNGFTIPQLKFGVLALGDTSYPLFCKTGEDVDTQFQKLGGKRIAPLQKCDLDYEEPANKWFSELLETLNTVTETVAAHATVIPATVPDAKKAPGKKIYTGKIITNINLNATGSRKTTWHIEIAADDVDFLPGDSIGIVPENSLEVVEEILSITKADGNKKLTWKNEVYTIRELLHKKVNISYMLDKAVKHYGAILEKELPAARVDLIDLLRKHPLNAEQFETLLLGLTGIAPRIYNIASSPVAHNGEVHITVLEDVFTINGQQQYGLCTTFFQNKPEGSEINFFIQPNKRFRLPAPGKDIIMIGPGTGIAPFRSFVAERDVTGAAGRNWLFFADEQFTTDFLYQTEWQDWFNTGVLTKINVAFSADGEEHLKVQHKLLQQATELFEWINNGAYVYLCGEKDPMSKEAEAALLLVIEQQGKFSKEEATKYFEQLKTEGRYTKDVY